MNRFDDPEDGGHRRRPPRPSMHGIRKSVMHSRRARRRSSARFLQLSRNDGPRSPEDTEQPDQENLQELYKQAIRMNAENKINASNSWSLCLVENIDNFLEEHEDEDAESEEETEEQKDEDKRRVNFTKASCTLDASVKIYSYRVDDVHLTSYKVLANLHRNSNKQTTESTGPEDREADPAEEKAPTKSSRQKNTSPSNTLESNIGKFLNGGSTVEMPKLSLSCKLTRCFSRVPRSQLEHE